MKYEFLYLHRAAEEAAYDTTDTQGEEEGSADLMYVGFKHWQLVQSQ